MVTTGSVQNSISVTSPVKSSKYSYIAEQYADQFAAFFGCSKETAKQLLSQSTVINGLKSIHNDFSKMFIGMTYTQIAEFVKHLDRTKAGLAKRAVKEGCSYSDLDEVYKRGTSIFTENNKHNPFNRKNGQKFVSSLTDNSKAQHKEFVA